MPVRSSILRIGFAIVVFAALTLTPIPVVAQDAAELTVATTATYDVMPEDGRVEVHFEYLLGNQEEGVAFPGFFESLPASASEVGASGPRGSLDVVPIGEEDGFTVWFVDFGRTLDPGETTTATLDWVISDKVDGAVVTPAAVAIDVFVPGPDGATWSPATVEVPDDFVPTAPTTTDNADVGDGRVRFRAETDAPYVVARFGYLSRAHFVEREIDAPPLLTIADWAPDGVWADAVEERVETVVETLDTWFGPRVEPFEIRRGIPADRHPAVMLEATPPVIVVDDDAAVSIDHQLAHAWMADVPVDEPWFIEGLAAAFAGGEPDPIAEAEIVAPIADEIGPAGVRAVVDALRGGVISYPGVDAEPQPLPADWRTLLDLVEGVGGAQDAASLFRSTIVDADGAAAIDRRASARVDYFALKGRAGVWVLPPFLRQAMAAWDFDAFAAKQGAVSDTLLLRDGLDAWAEELGLEPLGDARALFESATVDLTEVDALLMERQDALEAFDEAERLVNGDRGLLARVGLIGEDPDASLQRLRDRWATGDYAGVTDGSHDLADLVEGAVGHGTIRLLVPILIAVALWQVIIRLARKRRTRGQPAAE